MPTSTVGNNKKSLITPFKIMTAHCEPCAESMFAETPAHCDASVSERIRAGGFTLIELIVVMSLITVMLGFAVPQLRSTLFSDGTKKATRWLIVMIPATKTKAAREKKLMSLRVSIDQDKITVVDPQPSKEDGDEKKDGEDGFNQAPVKEKSIKLPSDVHILDVEFPNQDRISVGETDIYFYPKGYSDHAIIHIEDSEGKRYSFIIEPFLPNIKRIDDYVRF